MDYHSLPRKQLQALCKKHGIPANAANSEMADALTTLLKPKPQPQTHNSKLPEKRATRSREAASSETASKSNDVEEGLNMQPQKATNTNKILEQDLNKEPPRITRGRGSASTLSEAPKSAASKTAKMPTAGGTDVNSATKQQEIKKVRTRNGGSKHSNSKMPPSAEENVDAKTLSPSDKKKEKAGGIVLRRGRVKVRSPRNLSKSPESAQFTEEVAVTEKRNGVGMPCSHSCLVDAKKTRKKKRSVTFSDVIDVNPASIEHSTVVDVSKNIREPAKETMAEIQQGTASSLPKNMNSASMAKKVISTRKASRSVSEDVIAAQTDDQKISKEPRKAKELHTFKAEKTASIEIDGESDKKRAARGKKSVNAVGGAAAKKNKQVMVGDDFVKGDLIEAVPCARRSRRLTIVPTDVKCNHDMQLATEKSEGQSKDDHVVVSIAPERTEGDLPAETLRRSRRKTLAPLELNHVQSNVGSASQQMEQKVLKAEIAQSKSFTSEMTFEALESQQKQSELKTFDSIPVANEAGVLPIKSKGALSARNLRGVRQKASVTSTDQHITSTDEVTNKMGYQKILSGNLTENVDMTESEVHSKAALSTNILANSEPYSLQEVLNDAKPKGETAKTISVMPRSTRKSSSLAAQPDNETPVSHEPAFSSLKQEGLEIVVEAVCRNIQDNEDLGAIAQSHDDQSQKILVLKNTNVLGVEDPVSTPSKGDINHRDSFSCPFQVVIGEGGEGQNQISGEAGSISCNEEFEHNPCSIDVRSSSTTAIHCVAGDSETANTSPLVDMHSIKPDAAAAVKDQEFTEETSSATSPEHAISRLEFSTEKDRVIEQVSHAMDESPAIISLTKDLKNTFRSDSPVSRKIQEDKGSLEGNLHTHGITVENSIENYTDKDSLASSPSATVESPTEIPVDIATAEHEACTFKVHLLTSNQDKSVSMTFGGAADLIEQQPDQVVDLNLCEGEDSVGKVKIEVHYDLQKENHVGKVSNDAKAQGETEKLTPVMPRSARKTSNVSAQQNNGTPVSQEPAFTTQKQEGLEIVEETVDKNIQDSEDLGVIAQEQSQEILALKNANVPRVEAPVSSTASTEDVNYHNSFSCAFQVEIGEEDEEQNQISENADSIYCNGDFEQNTCSIDVRSSSMAAIYCVASDSEKVNTSPLVNTHSIKPDATAAVKDQKFTEKMPSATSPVQVRSSHEFFTEKDQVTELESLSIDVSAAITSFSKGINDTFSSESPVSTKTQDKGSRVGNLHMRGIELENSIENYTVKDSLVSSPSATMESATEMSVDIATAEHEACTVKVHLLTSDKEKIRSMTSGGAAGLIQQQPDEVVDLNLCEGGDAVNDMEMEVHDDLRKSLQDNDEGIPYDGVKSVVNRSTENDQLRQLSAILPSCSMEPGTALMPMESSCKTKQSCPSAIYKSARKAQFSVPWENTSLEAYTAPHANNEASLHSLNQEEKDAEIWGLNNHGMTSDGIDSASSEDEGSSADTEETLSDTEVCNFETEMLSPNIEENYSCSEDHTASDSENDTMFDSEESFSEMEGEFLSGDESEEQEISEEELSESEDDVEDEFEEYEASPVSQLVAVSESIDALYITGGLEEEQVEIIAASESSLSNDGVTQADIMNPLALDDTNCYAPDVEATDNDEKVGAQHEELLKHVVTEIQKIEDDVLYITGGLEEEQVEMIAASESCLSNDGISQADIMNPLALENDTNCCAPDVEPTDNDEKVGAQHEELLKHAVTEIQKIEDDALYITGGLEEEQVEITAASESSLSNDGVTQAEIMNPLALENDTKCCAPDVGPTDNDEKVGAQHEELLKHAVTEIQKIEDDALYITGGLEEEQVEMIAASESSLSNDGVTQAEIINPLALENDTNCCASDVEPTDNDEKVGAQHEEFLKHVVTEIQKTQDVVMTHNENISVEKMQSATDSTCHDSESFASLSFLFASPPTKVQEDGILESDISQESRALETEVNILPESGQETNVQLFSPCALSYKEVVAEVGQQTMDGANYEIELCESVGGLKELEINGQMVDCVEKLQKISPMHAATKIHENGDVLISYNDNMAVEQLQSTTSSTYQNSDLLTSLSSLFASPPSKVKEDAEFSLTPVQLESNAESLVSQVVASDTFEVDLCGNGPEIATVFIHEILNEVAPTMHCAEVESINAQVEEIHDKPLDDSQSPEESEEDKETPATYNLVHEITKEQSMKQIDLTLQSVRELRQLCTGNLMSAKTKTENETKKETENKTPAKTPSRLWMSATKQVHQPNTSIHQRDLPSANKRSALKALSSNIKATPSAAMQTPTAKGSQRPQNLMSAYEGNDGTGKHLVTPSPHAPMSSKRDFARSHHR